MVDWACELDRLFSAAIHITNDTERFFEAGVEFSGCENFDRRYKRSTALNASLIKMTFISENFDRRYKRSSTLNASLIKMTLISKNLYRRYKRSSTIKKRLV